MRRLRFQVAYDGTEFHGWQIQPHLDTIQGQLTRVIERIVPVTYAVPSVILAQFSVACAFAVRTMRVSFDQINRYVASVQAVKADEVKNFAATQLNADSTSVIVVGDAKQFLPNLQKQFPQVEVVAPRIKALTVPTGTLIWQPRQVPFCTRATPFLPRPRPTAGRGRGASRLSPLVADVVPPAYSGGRASTIDEPADCLAKFRSNRAVGWMMLAGIIAGHFA